MLKNQIFNISTEAEFESVTLDIFQFQYQNIPVYKQFCDLLKKGPDTVKQLKDIPFLPIELFKTHTISIPDKPVDIVFSSSGTTGLTTSKHYINDLTLYETSFKQAFKHFYGDIEQYTILALLPSYLERKGSSLVYMVNDLIQASRSKHSGFYLHNLDELNSTLRMLEATSKKTILIGVTFALLDLIEEYNYELKNAIVMETGGMKGKRKELIRSELHNLLCQGFGLEVIHSEYGMTELLSQAYSKGNGIFECPPWMKILIRDPEDPLSYLTNKKTGGVNVIDLANINSCSFIATQDLGKLYNNNSFEILGRFDNSDIRGCNLMIL